MHKRTSIRNQAVALLEAIAGVTVKASRLHNWTPAELPAGTAGISVYTSGDPTEDSRLSDVARGSLDRTLRLAIDIHTRCGADAGDPVDDVDGWCVLVEQAMDAFPTGYRGALALGIHLARTRIGISGEGEARHSAASLEYEILYRTAVGDPSSS